MESRQTLREERDRLREEVKRLKDALEGKGPPKQATVKGKPVEQPRAVKTTDMQVR